MEKQVCLVGYALNPKKLRRSDSSTSRNEGSEKSRDPNSNWRGGGLADILVTKADISPDFGSIHFQSWEPEVPLTSQPQYHVIIHKLTEDIDKEESREKLLALENYLLTFPNTCIVDPIESVRKVINRARTCQYLSVIQSRLGQDCPFQQPSYFPIEVSMDSLTIKQHMERLQITYPIICKPVEACGTPISHNMVVIVKENDLPMLVKPGILQQYHNHHGNFYKIYVIDHEVMIYCRPSLPDLNINEASIRSLAFDSRYNYPTINDFRVSPSVPSSSSSSSSSSQDNSSLIPSSSSSLVNSISSTNQTNDIPNKIIQETSINNDQQINKQSFYSWKLTSTTNSNEPIHEPIHEPINEIINDQSISHQEPSLSSMNIVHCPNELRIFEDSIALTASLLRQELGLTLFGFDMILPQETSSSKLSIIDINYFPSYKEVIDFPTRLRKYLWNLTNNR